MSPKPPSPRQLAYLRTLAERTGQTFVPPPSSAQASREIQRLNAARCSSRAERAIEQRDVPAQLEYAAAADLDRETSGYGSTAAWSQRA